MAAKAGPVGAYVNAANGPWPSGTTDVQAWGLWNAATGTTAQCAKIIFSTQSQFPGASEPQIAACIQLGIPAVVCVRPAYDTTAHMATDLATFTTWAAGLQSAGLKGWIVLWQEPQNLGGTPPNPTGPQYQALLQYDPNGTGIGGFHAAANAAGFQLMLDAASHTPSQWAPFFPHNTDGSCPWLDEVVVDFYCDTYLTGIRIDGAGSIMALADGAGLPFGVGEIGVTGGGTANQPTLAEMQAYLAYLQQVFGWGATGRLGMGKHNAPVMWFNGQFHQTLNQIVPLSKATYAQAAYCVNTGYPNLWAALQPQGSAALQITTTSLPGATQGAAYSAPVAATGGKPPYTWSVS